MNAFHLLPGIPVEAQDVEYSYDTWSMGKAEEQDQSLQSLVKRSALDIVNYNVFNASLHHPEITVD